MFDSALAPLPLAHTTRERKAFGVTRTLPQTAGASIPTPETGPTRALRARGELGSGMFKAWAPVF